MMIVVIKLILIVILIFNNNSITVESFFRQETNYYGVIKLDNKEFDLVPLNYESSGFKEPIKIMISSFQYTSSSRIKIKNYLFDLPINSNNSISNNNNSISTSNRYNMILYGNIIESNYKNNHKFNIIRIYHYLFQKDNNLINHFSLINKSLKYYYIIKTCTSHSILNSNKCTGYGFNLIELNTFNSIEINSKNIKMDNYNSNSIPGFDDVWFKKKLFDVDSQRMLIQGYYNGGSDKNDDYFQLINSFIHLPDPYKTCQLDLNTQPYCPYRQFPFYIRDESRCLTLKGCIPLGVCLSIVKPVCIEGYKLTSFRGESNGCFKYYCDFNLVDQIKSKY